LARKVKIPLLIGAPTVVEEHTNVAADRNSALLISREGRILSQHHKLHLVAFGEFIPLEQYLPFLRKMLPLTGEFIPGNKYTIFQLPTTSSQPLARFGVLICFEDIFPGMVRRFVKDGADFMVNITNDAWFGRSAAPYQHAANSVFRAVENRRPFVRSANTGLSCFIDRLGRICAEVSSGGKEIFIEGYKTYTMNIGPSRRLSFYTKYGDIFIALCSLVVGLFIIDYAHRRGYNK
jgi:apolipoprotein N-acyltransferase